jgi:sialate O-acetylesterase
MQLTHGLLPGHVLQRTAKGAAASITGATTTTAAGPVTGAITATVRKGRKTLSGFAARKIGETAADGSFTVTLKGLPTGGPYTVEFACGKQKATIDDVFVGDLWLMAGQSNMEGCGNISGAPEPHPLVRNFSMARTWELARDPLHFLAESPDPVHSGATLAPLDAARRKRAAIKGAGVGVWFGKDMHKRTKVPQGLIATAHGGTSMAQWDPALAGGGGKSLYGSMLLSLRAVHQPIAGVLWYQGCSDTDEASAAVFTKRMQNLVAAVRRDQNQPKLPWINVQISRVVQDRPDHGKYWNDIQDQQRLLPKTIPYCETVAAIDLELDDLIHISGKAYATLGLRMADAAARLVLGERGAKPTPQPVSASVHAHRDLISAAVAVKFANVVGGLQSSGPARGFATIDGAGNPVNTIYKTELLGDRAILHLTLPDAVGLRVMYGRGLDPVCTITDGRGHAIPAFAPLPVTGLPVVSPWFTTWNVTHLQPGEDIMAMPRPAADEPLAMRRAYTDPTFQHFINNHPEWEGKSGHAAFTCAVDIPEAMEVEVLTGYDGPFRLWLGDREIHTDMKGINPALRDAHRIKLKLDAGRHPIAVLMATNHGKAWGFFFRLARPGIKLEADTRIPMPA